MDATPLTDVTGQKRFEARPKVLRRLYAYVLAYRLRLAVAVAVTVGSAMLNLLTPHFLGVAVDQAHALLLAGPAAGAQRALKITALIVVTISLVRGLLTGYQGYIQEYLAQRVGADLRLAYFAKLQRLSFSFHDAVHSGDLITRGMLDIEGVRGFLETGFLRTINVTLLVAIGTAGLLTADWRTGLCALSFVPFVAWRAVRMGVALRITWQRVQALNAVITRRMEENLRGMRVVRAFAAHAHELAKFNHAAAEAVRLSALRISQRSRSVRTMNLAYYLAMALVLLVGGQRVHHHLITIGTLTEMLTFMTVLQPPLRQIGFIVNAGARASSAGARLFEVLDFDPVIANAPDAVDLPHAPAALQFSDVSFRYPAAAPGRYALSDISFTVAPGQVLGIAGPPGSGKSTIAQLIPRFYDAGSGSITVGGIDVRDLTLASLREAVGLVQQDVFLFDTSVHDNIAYADPLTEEEEVFGAAQTAQIHEHIAQLPQHYQSRVGERGVGLSGGQRQRLAIARGLLADPQIIIFDDSSSAIDAATEVELRAALDHKLQGKTIIVIAHRLNVLRNADEILVLDQGRIAERGTHAALLAGQGLYADLWRLQNQGAA